MNRTISVAAHPLLDVHAFAASWPAPLGDMASADDDLLALASESPPTVPLESSDEVRKRVRDLLRWGGFKPTGRNKPASEYLIKAVRENLLRPINVAVDACNVVSLHSGLPISVVDAGKITQPLRVAVAEPGSAYVFNPAGQTLQVDGLICLFDADGPCANAVKDSQRTKTEPDTTQTLSVVWGSTELPGRSEQAAAWYAQLLRDRGAKVEFVELHRETDSP